MDKAEKDRLDKYGKLVWDFANSKTTDDILTSFFENLQAAFNFSSDFIEKAVKKYPTKKIIIVMLSDHEQNLFDLLLERNEIFTGCNDFLNGSYFNLEKYDPINYEFEIEETSVVGVDNDDMPVCTRKVFIIPEKDIESYIDNTDFIHNDYKDDLKSDLKLLAELFKQIESNKLVPQDRFAEVEKAAQAYPQISKKHDYIKKTQDALKLILSQIIEADNAYSSKGFPSILARYNTVQKTKYYIDSEYNLIQKGPFVEELYYTDGYSDNELIFNAPISYCLVEYLKHPEYYGKERIAICQNCDNIFGKSKLNGHQKYCSACSRKNKMSPEQRADYMKSYRANPARKRFETKRKREKKIQHLMINAGKTRKQAEQIIDNDM